MQYKVQWNAQKILLYNSISARAAVAPHPTPYTTFSRPRLRFPPFTMFSRVARVAKPVAVSAFSPGRTLARVAARPTAVIRSAPRVHQVTRRLAGTTAQPVQLEKYVQRERV